jgi:NAD(P)-dependent dehydrogenase (short-subunit alcohol dehydrogenase family)
MSEQERSLEGRVAIVTGGGTGLGRATAHLFAQQGADLVLAGRRIGPLEQTAQEIEDLGQRALAAPADVTDSAQCEQLVRSAMGEFGRVDVLVNNAGGGYTKQPDDDWSSEEWNQIIAQNLSSVWFMSRPAAREMIARGKGAIVNISTSGSATAVPVEAPYCAAKAGVNSLTRSLAAAWTPKGVRVNGVAPGAIHTAAHAAEAEKRGLPSNAVLGTGNGMNRVAEPEEIATAVLYLASDASSYCSGETLWVNGGPTGWGGA